MSAKLRRTLIRWRRDDRGMSMVELTVGMVVMSVMMAMFMTSVVQIFRAANKTDNIATSQSQISIAFQRLDTEIRYAEGLSTPTTSAPWYVEFVTAATGTAICTQLWLDTTAGQLKRRTWTQGGSYSRIVGVPLASGITPTAGGGPPAGQPFRVLSPDTTYNVQRLQLRLTATTGGGTSGSTQNLDVTFTAMNTSMSTASTTVCTEGRSIPW
jgi:prepilin-type N-terminal cleavage/methylation domain-containing protein